MALVLVQAAQGECCSYSGFDDGLPCFVTASAAAANVTKQQQQEQQ